MRRFRCDLAVIDWLPALESPQRGARMGCMMNTEPAPGARLEPQDFENIIRLTPLVSIDLVVRSPDRRVLVGCRRNEPAKGSLFTTGGRITKNETIAAAFRRISLAELGIERRIEEAQFLGVYEHFYATNNPERSGFGTHYVVLAYELTAPSQDWRLPKDQHGEFAWLSEAELLKSPRVHPYTKAYFLTGPSAGGRITA
jgi:colanic acid biosynthesis protein WcaH